MAVRYFYVRHDGTAGASDNGIYTALNSGSFASARVNDWEGKSLALFTDYFYASRIMVMSATTPPIAGDIIIESHINIFNNGGGIINPVYPSIGVPITIVSVDDLNTDNYMSGSEDRTTSAFRTGGAIIYMGKTLSTSNALSLNSNSSAKFIDCILNLNSTNDYIGSLNDAGSTKIINSVINCTSPSNGFEIRGGSEIVMVGGSILATTTVTSLLRASSVNAGGNLKFIGVNMLAVGTWLLGNHGGTNNDDMIEMRIDKCILNPSVGYIAESLIYPGTSILVTNSAAVAAEAEYQFYWENWLGIARDQNSLGIFRDESESFTSGEKVSIKCNTTANVSRFNPFVFDFPTKEIDLALAASDTVRVYFTIINTTTLTDADIWFELIYPDGTTANIYNYLSSENADPLAAGTTHTADSGSTWKNGASDLTGYNEYYMDVDTSVLAGSIGIPTVRINIAIPLEVIYIDTSIEAI